MVHRTAARISLRSRERKLRLFLDLFHPGPETTVVDVGVTDAPFGDGSSDNFFEALYPWPDRITGVGHTELDRFAAAFPTVTAVRADGRELPFADGEFDLGFSNAVIEHVAGGRARPAAVHLGALPRLGEGLRHDSEPALPDRSALAAPVRPLASGRRDAEPGAAGQRLRRRARPARPRRARRAVPLPGEDRQPRDDARRRRPAVKRHVWILHVFVVGLALHNFAMAELYAAGVRGNALDVVSAWKELLLALGLLLVWRDRGWSLRFRPALVDWLALGYGALVVLSAILPQHWLGGGATHRGVVLGVRHDLLPVAAYFFGRGLDLTVRDARKLGVTVIASACAVAAFGLIDIYAIPLSWWRSSGAPDWFSKQLGFTYTGLEQPAAELRLQHGERPRLPAARLGLPLPARRLVHVRDGAPALRGLVDPAPAEARRLDPDRRSALRRSPLDALAQLLPRARCRARRVRDPAAPCAGCARRRGRPRGRRRLRLREGLPAHRAEDELHAARAAHPGEARERPRRHRGRRVERARGREHLEPSQEPASTGSRPSSAIRRDTGRGTPARPLPAPTSRSRPASRPTPSSESTPGSSAGCSSSRGC